MPWLKRMEREHGPSGLVMVGVHTPEFFYERSKRAVQAEVDKQQLGWPQLIDVEGVYWERAGNRAWPSVYLVDKKGVVRARYVGTIYDGDHRSKAISEEISSLLAEP